MEGNGIKSWAEADRPREKLLQAGARALTESELLAILIRTGTRTGTAVDVAKDILAAHGNDLHELARMSVPELARFSGMGQVKAVTVVAALELGRRRREGEALQRPHIASSRDAAGLMLPHLSDLRHEEFHVLLLSRSNRVIRRFALSKGGVAGTVVDPKVVFKEALDHLASGMILFHNHPSGNLKPSAEDIRLTKRLRDAGQLMEIKVLDHILVAGNRWFSFADEGLM